MDAQKTVHAVWDKNWVCDIAFGEFGLRVDEPESVPGGSNQGPNPTAILLGAVASCFTLAVAWAAQRRKIHLDHLLVDATGTYDGNSFGSIRIDADVGCDASELDALLKQAERACYVTNTLRGGVELTIVGTAHGS